ncbi:MAG: AN1-type zinc finger domain-containing protein, partial [Candidatus Caldarchaeum sp.]|nr:AN1-type zinc finger domain-containing protein [Candidatus Caldarchaeum sp.]
KCLVCGVEELLPFRCNYCSGVFCPSHRLPENHGCVGRLMARSPLETRRAVVRSPSRTWTRFSEGFASSEAVALTVACLAVWVSGVSLLGWPALFSASGPLLLLGLTASFLGHELAHKLTAMRKGLYATFRLFLPGLLATILTALIPTPFKVIMPGAVAVGGRQTLKDLGVIALSGPAFNMLLASLLLLGSAVSRSGVVDALAAVNAFIAFFNLLPIMPLDGEKVLGWSLKVWATAFAASLVLLMFAGF